MFPIGPCCFERLWTGSGRGRVKFKKGVFSKGRGWREKEGVSSRTGSAACRAASPAAWWRCRRECQRRARRRPGARGGRQVLPLRRPEARRSGSSSPRWRCEYVCVREYCQRARLICAKSGTYRIARTCRSQSYSQSKSPSRGRLRRAPVISVISPNRATAYTNERSRLTV